MLKLLLDVDTLLLTQHAGGGRHMLHRGLHLVYAGNAKELVADQALEPGMASRLLEFCGRLWLLAVVCTVACLMHPTQALSVQCQITQGAFHMACVLCGMRIVLLA